jgi:hypothetical protein
MPIGGVENWIGSRRSSTVNWGWTLTIVLAAPRLARTSHVHPGEALTVSDIQYRSSPLPRAWFVIVSSQQHIKLSMYSSLRDFRVVL